MAVLALALVLDFTGCAGTKDDLSALLAPEDLVEVGIGGDSALEMEGGGGLPAFFLVPSLPSLRPASRPLFGGITASGFFFLRRRLCLSVVRIPLPPLLPLLLLPEDGAAGGTPVAAVNDVIGVDNAASVAAGVLDEEEDIATVESALLLIR